ncbi:MFS transporter [Pseudofrankia sp. BMG5.37]|uniref:MFS transporter n=1 Tax=Pseudofrankia sp. BMG5.37 TaxID=3050035 RepID=UPI002895F511|nr:MFS transporter [Pseudofrankia sp. BMG5.37]MDT3439955.1 MFS transporter [Pseudofrankia sp. BMG5.37]
MMTGGDAGVVSAARAESASADADTALDDGGLDVMSGVIARVRQRRAEGRRLLLTGASGEAGQIRSLGADIATSGTGWYLLIALSLFAALDEATAYLVTALGPDISSSLGVDASTYAMLATQRQTFVGLTALQFAAIFYKRSQRVMISKNLGFQYGPSLVLGSIVTWVPAMTTVIGSSGAGAAVVYSAHRPMIMDSYPPAARLRALSFHRGAGVIGAILGPALVAILAGPVGLSWRGVLLVAGVVFLAASLIGLCLREPGYGRHDSDQVAGLMRTDQSGPPPRREDATELTFWEALRRVWTIRTVRRLLSVWAVLGVAVNPVVTYQGFWLKEQFSLTTSERATFFAASWLLALPALWYYSRRGEKIWRREPAQLVRMVAWALVFLAGGLVLAVIPVLGVSLAGFSIVFASEAVAVAALSLVMMSIVRPRARSIAVSLGAVYFGLVGGEGGTILLGDIESRYSAAAAIATLVVPALGAAALLGRGAKSVTGDLDSVVSEILEDEGVRDLAVSGRQEPPLLACRGIDFSYGQLQVLFGVDFTVRDGEMLALLGVNGAGKSSLLKVISGLGMPSAGSVRLRGHDITYVDAEKRVSRGITQIPGGRAVFGPLTVAENLRGLGFSLGRDKKRLDAAIDECFEMFPRLAERRNQPALTLSGGEQQMLALSKAFILKPRLLLIDELSLGLAPIVVDRLLAMVRQINAAGTAVVLVEQSISLALSVVNHAYFMEKGQVRFDGSSADLLARDDLLRAVFLGAASQGGNGA